MTMTSKNYIHVDEHGVMRVSDSRVMLDSIVASFHQGCSAETIQQQYPALSLEEVYGAIAWYLANLDEANRYLEQQKKLWQQSREQADAQANPALQRLRKMQLNKTAEIS